MLAIDSFNPDQRLSVAIAIFFAEDVLSAFEKQHPNDIRPRAAIEAAKAWLRNPCQRTAAATNVTAGAAADAAHYIDSHYIDSHTAASDAAYTASYTAASAAYPNYAADSAASATASAARSALSATHTFPYRSERRVYIHSKLVRLLPYIFEYKIFTKTSFKDPEQVFDLLSEKNQQRFLFSLNHLR
tara:strand:- start:1883 stop:2443 length:561 start_codon:yes stop_codon:yes gene_type:complete